MTSQIEPDKSRVAKLKTITIAHGAHETFAEGHCAMEAVAWLAKEPHSDTPTCACPAIGAFVRRWNDSIRDDATRTQLLAPLLPLIIGTRGTDDDVLVRRSYMAVDRGIRVVGPAWLRLAGLSDHAEAMAALPEIVDAPSLKCAHGARAAARGAARGAAYAAARGAARGAAYAAAYAAASDAVCDAARAAASAAAYAAASASARAAAKAASAYDCAYVAACDAARAAAYDCAYVAACDAARAAAYDSARAAARATLAPTVAGLQASAQDLVRRMCAVTK